MKFSRLKYGTQVSVHTKVQGSTFTNDFVIRFEGNGKRYPISEMLLISKHLLKSCIPNLASLAFMVFELSSKKHVIKSIFIDIFKIFEEEALTEEAFKASSLLLL